MLGMRPEFLSPHPPQHSRELVRDLFLGRERELHHVKRELDPANDHRQILAIYGETRVGKSHLALRAVQEVPTGEHGYFYVYVNANQRLTTEPVLWEIFRHLADEALSLQATDPLTELAVQWIGDILEFNLSNVETVTLRSKRGRLEEAKKSITAKGEGSVEGTILDFIIKGKVGFGVERVRSATETRNEEEEVVITLSKPSADHLTEIIAFLGSVMVKRSCCRHVLLLVDDVDLLSSETNAPKTEADNLVDALRRLANQEGFTVIATVREDFRERKGKDFRTLCLVERFPEEESILEIYRTHVQHLNRGVFPYTQEAVTYLAKAAGGLVGRFLDECDRMRQHFTGADGDFSLDRVFEYYRREATRRAGPELGPALGVIEAAAKTGRATVGAETFDKLGFSMEAIKTSPLVGRVLHPSRYRADVFEIDPFIWGALRGGPA